MKLYNTLFSRELLPDLLPLGIMSVVAKDWIELRDALCNHCLH